MAKLIIKREKSMMGAALAMNCYDGDTLLCRVKEWKRGDLLCGGWRDLFQLCAST